MLERLVYVSRASNRQDITGQLAKIAGESEARNMETGISGVLVAHEGHFIQTLEGERPVLDELLRRLENDARHYDLVLVDRWWIDDRLFAGWAMAGVAMNRATREDVEGLIADPTRDPRLLVENLRSRAVPLAGATRVPNAAG